MTTPSQTGVGREDQLAVKVAWVVWAILAVAIPVLVVVRHDFVQTTDGANHVGTIVANNADALTIIGRVDDGPVKTEVLPREQIEVVFRHGDRSVTNVYWLAAHRWWLSCPIYGSGSNGFLYLPQAAQLFTPFAVLPTTLAEVLWRWAGLTAYAAGIWRLSNRLHRDRQGPAFLIASLAAIPAAMGSMSNGQTNLAIGGLAALAAADVASGRRTTVALWLLLALVCKPYSIVFILLFGAVYPRTIPALVIGGIAIALAPFAHPDPAYVAREYLAFIDKLRVAGAPVGPFQDLRGMLMDFGLAPGETVLTAGRVLAALAVLGACLLARRRLTGPKLSAVVMTLGAAYLMLFNPRTEGVSYAIIGPAAGVWTAAAVLQRSWTTAGALIIYCLLLQFSRALAVGSASHWARPLATVLFLAYIVHVILRSHLAKVDRRGFDAPEVPECASPGLSE